MCDIAQFPPFLRCRLTCLIRNRRTGVCLIVLVAWSALSVQAQWPHVTWRKAKRCSCAPIPSAITALSSLGRPTPKAKSAYARPRDEERCAADSATHLLVDGL